MDPTDEFRLQFSLQETDIKDEIALLPSKSQEEYEGAKETILAKRNKLQGMTNDFFADHKNDFVKKQRVEDLARLRQAFEAAVELRRSKLEQDAKPSRFKFRPKTKHVDMGAVQNDPRYNPGVQPTSQARVTALRSQEQPGHAISTPGKDYNQEMAQPSDSQVRKPSFSTVDTIEISKQKGLHIILPLSASRATAAGSLQDLEGCIVDMSVPTNGAPLPSLALKNISGSLVIAGRVSSSVHITNVKDSIVVLTAQQARIHDCKNVRIYLFCASDPVIESCSEMRFAPLPTIYANDTPKGTTNRWDRIEDFSWRKGGENPNWTVIPENQRLEDTVWAGVMHGRPGASLEETLASVGLR
ncbi:Tubulin-specific chaperone C [Emericellopsis cladophorae]|uniref:Tubulin-specific chaperone C n=1 Tax=Emericellopsis cladophorae TaxID=2686198 RepID=A0A9Q0BB50_9HYPO|nr:Tubulin-specific chaperone C [Emericellopsis cladophorae]KAI6778130.1 Tubulin-specific chaperone C [Emericellopsis cladophorae]